MRTIEFRVAGVTFEGRQAKIERLFGDEPCRIEPEPENRYDENALAVKIAKGDEILHVGYVPKDAAAVLAKLIEGEPLMADRFEIVGGFEQADGSLASLGLRVFISFPDEMYRDLVDGLRT